MERGVLFALGSVSGGLSRSGKLPPVWWVQWGGQQPQLRGGELGWQILGATWEGIEWLGKHARSTGILRSQHRAFRGQSLVGFWPQRWVHEDSRGQAGWGWWHRDTSTLLQVEHQAPPPPAPGRPFQKF